MEDQQAFFDDQEAHASKRHKGLGFHTEGSAPQLVASDTDLAAAATETPGSISEVSSSAAVYKWRRVHLVVLAWYLQRFWAIFQMSSFSLHKSIGVFDVVSMVSVLIACPGVIVMIVMIGESDGVHDVGIFQIEVAKERTAELAAKLESDAATVGAGGVKRQREWEATVSEKIYLPVGEDPDFDWVGLILGPNGRTQEEIESETRCHIDLHGKGSPEGFLTESVFPSRQQYVRWRTSKLTSQYDGARFVICAFRPTTADINWAQAEEDSAEPLHVVVGACDQDDLDNGCRRIRGLISQDRKAEEAETDLAAANTSGVVKPKTPATPPSEFAARPKTPPGV
eukprot:6333389-Pyramimonas_sp.AAC.2